MKAMTPEQAKGHVLAGLAREGADHINCAQAVFRFALLLKGHNPDLTTVLAYLGGGVAGMGEVCGAITGAALALGMRDYHLPEDNPDQRFLARDRLQELTGEFVAEFGTRRCRDLTGHDLSTPEGFEAFHNSEARARCPEYVSWMCDHIIPLLDDGEETQEPTP